MREPFSFDQSDSYERPNQTWICGLSEEGPQCPLGPGVNGHCPQSAACHPLREGDRWKCNRAPLRGGECSEGPTPEGKCCHHYVCHPVRSLRAKRGRFVKGCLLASIGALCLLLSGNWRNEFIAPGKLSVHHAQLLVRGEEQTNRCASCHVAGNQSMLQWLAHATNPTLATPTQSTLCLECHKKDFPIDAALWAHNIEPEILLSISEPGQSKPETFSDSTRRRDPAIGIACSNCHQEHHGAEHDLTAMSDSSCQACHREEFHSFATDHPEFDKWPERRRTRIAFDHASHQAKHFPDEKQTFACSDCHRQGPSGAFQETLDYESTCAKCHDSKIQTSWTAGIPAILLPMIDVDTLSTAGHDIGIWPDSATGDFDGALPFFTKLLLLADEEASAAIDTLGADFDFYDIDPDEPAQLQAAANVIKATKRLIADLQYNGQTAINTRLEKLLGRPLSAEELTAASANLSPASISILATDWLAEQGANSFSSPDDKVDSNKVAAGGWFTDPVTFSLRYRATGHADPFLTAWIDILVEATAGQHKVAAEKLFSQMMKPTAAGLCGSCHSVDRTENGQLTVNWFAKQSFNHGPQFTVFSHAPHVLQFELADCTACHSLNQTAQAMKTYEQTDPRLFTPEFHELTRQDCAECHKPGAAGDSCTQCHRYHAADVR
ncbi:hypothetical protein [Bythopirellula polymerisocia]|uniref:hypothetical protein n=1 Tax=Bythopirellula polymerisocia TaxID=2528003 RepID=UPI0011B63A2D|nr:hypothetical protein [Bythopirellula polymerisocia]